MNEINNKEYAIFKDRREHFRKLNSKSKNIIQSIQRDWNITEKLFHQIKIAK